LFAMHDHMVVRFTLMVERLIHCIEVYLIQPYVIKFASDLWEVCYFVWVLWSALKQSY
jgi:hypothetical protein